jgi:hypothetical protein
MTTEGGSASFHGQTPGFAPQGNTGIVLGGIGPYIDWYPDPRGGFHATVLALGVLGGGGNGQLGLDIGSGFAVGGGLGYIRTSVAIDRPSFCSIQLDAGAASAKSSCRECGTTPGGCTRLARNRNASCRQSG